MTPWCWLDASGEVGQQEAAVELWHEDSVRRRSGAWQECCKVLGCCSAPGADVWSSGCGEQCPRRPPMLPAGSRGRAP